ncbi:hypothetical protein BDB00DRAFT_850467 [Zychaea mexicana]|uniref:uncharacterized protein n=1 Tax=Zychaea mexicana TaxID=64656 RepID=UPI0022FE0B05|nr:uncharacterized protein BDB00DRAFT_850467 [Zychaea mexicana]KAI9487976.1 hypothetical protein BDB00DRAFT_850467 [Zychaea mexicana]
MLRQLRLFFLIACLLSVLTVSAVEFEKRVPQDPGQQPAESDNASPAPAEPTSAPAAGGSSGGGAAPPNTVAGSQQPQGNQSVASGGSNNPLSGLPTTGSFGNTIYPGMVSFLEPTGSKSVSPLYRIDSRENVTFRWEFESLKVQPVNLTLAAVGPQSATYTITQMGGAETSAVWHLSDVPAETPLFNGMYQIQLYDQRGVSAHAEPGYMAPATRLTIAFYNPESYRPLTGTDYCPTCFYDAGNRLLSHYFGGLGVAFGVACVTSFMFIYGLLY